MPCVPEDPTLKSQKPRKGTTSCWQCKRRKKRCVFGPDSPSACYTCQRLGLSCTSQEFEEPETEKFDYLNNRIGEIEALVDRLVQQRHHSSQTKCRTSLDISRKGVQKRHGSGIPTLRSVGHERLSRGPSLTGFLYSVLPDPDTAVVILSSRKLFSSPLQMAQRLNDEVSTRAASNREPYVPVNSHPVIFAQKLLQLAICLKQFDASSSGQLVLHMTESPNEAAKRFVDVAFHLVISQENLVASLDGLETLMLQGCYYATIGDFQTSWAIQRRAANIALAIDLPRLAETSSRAERLWFQIAFSDRFLSLIIGVPFVVVNDSFASTEKLASVSPAHRLERIHGLMAGRIITRNVRIQGGWDSQDESFHHEVYQETRNIDRYLKESTRLLPPTWWLMPSLDAVSDAEAMERTVRLLAQMHQYYLLVLLHQPYLIRSQEPAFGNIDTSHCKATAASASREVLSRYLMIRNYRRSPSYRGLDEKAFVCSAMLLFAHLIGHGSEDANFLEHQRSHDLGIFERVIGLWKEISVALGDSQCVYHSRKLRRLMNIEENAVNGSSYYTWNDREPIPCIDDKQESDLGEIRIWMPYFGDLVISPQPLMNEEPAIQNITSKALSENGDALDFDIEAANEELLTFPEAPVHNLSGKDDFVWIEGCGSGSHASQGLEVLGFD